MYYPAFASGSVAAVTGPAAIVGIAALRRLRRVGMNVCLADLGADTAERR
jgi:hypothetical protein